MKKSTNVSSTREQGTRETEAKRQSMKVRTKIKAGTKPDPERIALNHNETLAG